MFCVYKKILSTQTMGIKNELFWKFQSTKFFNFFFWYARSVYLVVYEFSRYLTKLVYEVFRVQIDEFSLGQAVFLSTQDQWFSMRVHKFAGAITSAQSP